MIEFADKMVQSADKPNEKTAMPTIAAKPITADELLYMGDIGRCELIYGELVMLPLSKIFKRP